MTTPTNGALSLSTLTLVDGWAYLIKNTAAAWECGCDDLVALGYERPQIMSPDGAYRTLARQEYWKKFWSDRGQPLNAATVGTSGHGWATDIDIRDVWKWPHDVLVKVFGRYGFTFNFSPEPWHMHHDGMAVASLGATRIIEQKEDHDMSDLQYYERVKVDGTKVISDNEWMRGGASFPGGYEVTLDGEEARRWGRQISGEGTIPVHLTRDLYVAQQVFLKADAAKWEARQVKRLTDVMTKLLAKPAAPAAPVTGVAELGPKSLAALNAVQTNVVAAIPKTFTAVSH